MINNLEPLSLLNINSRILIVDDTPDNIETLEQILEDFKYDIYKAVDGDDALKMIEEVEPNLILLDVMMPGKDGYEVAKIVKQNKKTRLIPIIMLTALDGQDERLKGYQAGVDDFISKPFNIFELRARVHNLLRLHSYISELDHAEQIIFSLARTVEAKDKYTEGHSERLSKMSAKLGRKTNLSEADLIILRRGGILHDIGKIAIQDSILQKEGTLSDEEYEIIKTHPAEGVRICAPLKSLKPILPVINFHHEKYDGSGYPTGLKGSDIPIHARIMGIVDCFDALTTTRSYRPSMSIDKTLGIMENETRQGKWDPYLFQKFLELVEDMELVELV
jgi:putative two-component system response regulator